MEDTFKATVLAIPIGESLTWGATDLHEIFDKCSEGLLAWMDEHGIEWRYDIGKDQMIFSKAVRH